MAFFDPFLATFGLTGHLIFITDQCKWYKMKACDVLHQFWFQNNFPKQETKPLEPSKQNSFFFVYKCEAYGPKDKGSQLKFKIFSVFNIDSEPHEEKPHLNLAEHHQNRPKRKCKQRLKQGPSATWWPNFPNFFE